jgi:hypothetical protein
MIWIRRAPIRAPVAKRHVDRQLTADNAPQTVWPLVLESSVASSTTRPKLQAQPPSNDTGFTTLKSHEMFCRSTNTYKPPPLLTSIQSPSFGLLVDYTRYPCCRLSSQLSPFGRTCCILHLRKIHCHPRLSVLAYRLPHNFDYIPDLQEIDGNPSSLPLPLNPIVNRLRELAASRIMHPT